MTIKEATMKMLQHIEIQNTINCNQEKVRSYDKQIANKLELTPASYSRLRTGVTEPKIMTWYKIIKLCRDMCGNAITDNIIIQIL